MPRPRSCWRCRGRLPGALRLAFRILLNTAVARAERLRRRLCSGRRRVAPEPPQIQRLQALASAAAPEPRPDTAQDLAAGRAEILVEIFAFCSVCDVGRCAAASQDFRQGAEHDALWHCLCRRRWRDRQHSVHVRRWLAEASARPVPEDLFTDYACEEQRRLCEERAGSPPAEPPRRCRVASWRDRYVFAERDARRVAITREELCWDSPFAGGRASGSAEAARETAAAQSSQRRWGMTLRFDVHFDLEGFFHHDGRFFDTARFRRVSAPWHFVYGDQGEVMVQITPTNMNMDIPPLRVERSADWGWRLIATGSFAEMVRFSSRQLSIEEHRAAAATPPEVSTLYMRRLSVDTQMDRRHVPYGAWQCFRAYQGTMPAPSWIGRQIIIEQGSLTITFSATAQEEYQCEVNELECTIDITRRASNGEEVSAQRGCYQIEAEGRVLVATRNELGGPRPRGPPTALPSLREILREELMDVGDTRAQREMVHM